MHTISTHKNSDLTIKNLIKLNIKYIFNNTKTLLGLLFFLVVAVVVPTIFLPIRNAGSIVVIVGLIMPSLSVMGEIGYGLRSSTLFKNIKTTGYKNRQFYIPTIITILFLQFILSIILFTTLWILGECGFLMVGWRNGGLSMNIITKWFIIFYPYLLIISTLISFSFYFLIHNIVNTQKNYHAIVLSTFILSIIFGGSLNTYFSSPMTAHVPYVQSAGFENLYEMKVDGLPTQLFFYSQSMYDTLGFSSNLKGQWFNGGLFPDNLFIPTLLFPFYGIGQFSTILLGEPVFFENYRNAYLIIVPDDIYTSMLPNEIFNVISEMWNSGDESFTNLISVFDIYDNAFSFSSFISFKIDSQNWRWTLVVIQPYFTLVLYFLIGTIIIKIKK